MYAPCPWLTGEIHPDNTCGFDARILNLLEDRSDFYTATSIQCRATMCQRRCFIKVFCFYHDETAQFLFNFNEWSISDNTTWLEYFAFHSQPGAMASQFVL